MSKNTAVKTSTGTITSALDVLLSTTKRSEPETSNETEALRLPTVWENVIGTADTSEEAPRMRANVKGTRLITPRAAQNSGQGRFAL